METPGARVTAVSVRSVMHRLVHWRAQTIWLFRPSHTHSGQREMRKATIRDTEHPVCSRTHDCCWPAGLKVAQLRLAGLLEKRCCWRGRRFGVEGGAERGTRSKENSLRAHKLASSCNFVIAPRFALGKQQVFKVRPWRRIEATLPRTMAFLSLASSAR